MIQCELFPVVQESHHEQPPASDSVLGKTVTSVSNCIDCPQHRIVRDPDPTDWFCDDDIAVLCSLTPNPTIDPSKAWKSGEIWPHRAVTTSCRPFEFTKRRECETPSWCPKQIG